MSELCYASIMPDHDGIHAHFKGSWKSCVHYISEGPKILAHALHATLTASDMLMEGSHSLCYVREQLLNAQGTPSHEMIFLPDILRLNRSAEPVLHAAHATLDDLPRLPNDAKYERDDTITERLVENYLVEVAHQQFLGIAEIKAVPAYYPSPLVARESITTTVKELRERLSSTVKEVCADLESPQITQVSRPRRTRKSQKDVLAIEVPIKL